MKDKRININSELYKLYESLNEEDKYILSWGIIPEQLRDKELTEGQELELIRISQIFEQK